MILSLICLLCWKANNMSMRMAQNSKNYRVLKLVHPGGFIEIHQKPITAYEVMKKNPRHCVTRPDVFRYPWVVVRPESVLKPGSVFYIVPFHTIQSLMQRNRCLYQNYLFQEQDSIDSSVELTYFHQFLEERSSGISQKRTKVDCKIDQYDAIFPEGLIRNKKCPEPAYYQGSLIKSRFKLEHLDDSLKIQYLIDHLLTAHDCENHVEFEQQDTSFIEPRPAFSLDTASSNVPIDDIFLKVDSGLEPNVLKEKQSLKSCLKKDNRGRSHGFRVTFASSR
ncbi:uncharacterized protein LOC8274988 [Ricinus communis]|nr:uncharacterized protein LOC8274988 [Ricinus communis]